uniref:Uncharacterized protein n=1 Tax=Kalanchoe fedtschenkoi TaxID=63787 RepID=A0A7N0RE77_KALFE
MLPLLTIWMVSWIEARHRPLTEEILALAFQSGAVWIQSDLGADMTLSQECGGTGLADSFCELSRLAQ